MKARFVFPILAALLAAGVLLVGNTGTSGHIQSPIPPAPSGVPTPPDDLASRRPPISQEELKPPLPSDAPPSTGTICDIPGERLQGGETFRLGKLSLSLPEGSDYVVSVLLQEDGTLVRACSVQANSAIAITFDGKESFRTATQADANAVLDAILSRARVER